MDIHQNIYISILSLNGSTVDEFIVPEILNEKRVVTWSPGTQVSSGMYIISAMSGSKDTKWKDFVYKIEYFFIFAGLIQKQIKPNLHWGLSLEKTKKKK